MINARIRSTLSEDELADLLTNERQIRAIETLIKGVQNRTIKVSRTGEELDTLIARLKTVRGRLEQIDVKLKLAVKCGIVSTAIH